MKNENELLRLQVTKAANQADVAEKRLEETLKVSLCVLNAYNYGTVSVIYVMVF